MSNIYAFVIYRCTIVADLYSSLHICLTGLEFIKEFVSKRAGDNRQYTCTLDADGCRGVWAGSYCIAKHLCGNKHRRNYLVHVAKIPGADGMTKNMVLEAAIEQEAKLRSQGEERD